MRVLFVIRDLSGFERLGVMSLSAALKKTGHDVRLAVEESMSYEEIAQLVAGFQPGIIGYSVMTGEHRWLVELNRKLKKDFTFVSIFGGAHPTFFPHMIDDEEDVDAICVGEGDLAFSNFCARFEKGESYWDTPTFHVKHNGKIHRNPLADLVDVEELPFPDRKIVYDANPAIAQLSNKTFMVTRGCPYKCAYCFNAKYNDSYRGKGKIMRTRSPEKIVQEIEWVRDNYPLSNVGFMDDLFFSKPKGWLDEFCRLYKKRIGLPFTCTARANVTKEETVVKLKDAGMTVVWMGVECGDEKVANEILSRGLSNEQIIKAAKIIRDHGVHLISQNLIGLPVDDPFKVDLETLDLNIKIKPAFAWSSILYPYPGTPIEKYALKSGHLKGDEPMLETNKRSSILNFQDPHVARKIENLHKLFGLIVRFPILRPFSGFLSSLPFSGFYRGVYFLWYGYCLRIKIAPMGSLRKELPYYIRLFFRMRARS